MRDVSRRSLLGLEVHDCHGREVGRVVDTWPDYGGWELDLVVVRLTLFGERRMLPADQVSVVGGVLLAAHSQRQIEDAPAVDQGRHGADDPYRAKAYWMFEEPGDVGIVTPQWRRSSGSSVTARPSPTSQGPTPTAS